MDRKGLLFFAAATVLVTLAGIGYLDRPLAEWIRASGWEQVWIFPAGTRMLDTISGVTLHKFLPGLVLVAAGAALLVSAFRRRAGIALLFVGATHLVSTVICGLGKGLFQRLRPYEVLDGGNWDQAWFASGSGFPSGHAAIYFGLFLPLAYLFPRWRWPLLAPPLFIAAARVSENKHFLGDVTSAMAVAALVTALLAMLLRVEPGRMSNG